MRISKQAHRRFVLGMQGLWPGRRWKGFDGVQAALQECRRIRVDPLNVIGRAQDLAFLSRVMDLRQGDLDRLLYKERGGFEHGGAVSIYPRQLLRPHWSWVKKEGFPVRWEKWYAENMNTAKRVKREIETRGPLEALEWAEGEHVENYRSSKLEGLALYYLWRHFDIMIHHRDGVRKFYDLTTKMFGSLPEPLPKEPTLSEMAFETMSWLGLSGQEGIPYIRTQEDGRGKSKVTKRQIRQRLVDDGRISAVEIEGERLPAVLRSDRTKLLEVVAAGDVPRQWKLLHQEPEATILAPLDTTIANGRSLSLFGFEYLWEVYKPVSKRRWGYYVLPVLYGDQIVGRIEPVYGREDHRLRITQAWWEPEANLSEMPTPFARGILRLAKFLGASSVVTEEIGLPKFKEAVSREVAMLR